MDRKDTFLQKLLAGSFCKKVSLREYPPQAELQFEMVESSSHCIIRVSVDDVRLNNLIHIVGNGSISKRCSCKEKTG